MFLLFEVGAVPLFFVGLTFLFNWRVQLSATFEGGLVGSRLLPKRPMALAVRVC